VIAVADLLASLKGDAGLLETKMATADEALPYLAELIDATNEGRISWTIANPNNIHMGNSGPCSARIVIQQVNRSEVIGASD